MSLFIAIILVLVAFYVAFLTAIKRGIESVSKRQWGGTLRNKEFPKVAVIVPFRNEEVTILKSYKSLSSQNYPKDRYDVYYVDDFSDDEGFEKIMNENRFSNIHVLKNDDIANRGHKKRAILMGINASDSEIILTTDADCIHNSDWIRTVANSFNEGVGFVSSPVVYYSEKEDEGGIWRWFTGLFSRIQKLEFMGLVLTGAGLIGIGKPILCNGANIAYRREAFRESGGFDDNLNISSGDDEFLMQKIAGEGKYSVLFCMKDEAVVKTKDNKGLSSFIMQRRRWSSKTIFYKGYLIVPFLVLIYLYYLSFPILITVGFFDVKFFFLAIVSFVLKSYYEYEVLKKGVPMLSKGIGIVDFIIAEICHVPYIVLIPIIGIFGNYKWKGRKIEI